MGLTANAAPSPSGTAQNPASITADDASVPEGSGITDLQITTVPADSPARTSVAAQVEGMKTAGIPVQKVILAEITAKGSGMVQFNVGKEYAGNHVYLKHYNGTAWEDIGSGIVSKDGIVSFTLKDFSPYAIMITSVKDAAPASSKGSSSSSTTDTASTTAATAASPKTGETMTILAVELLAVVCVITAIVAGKKVRRAN